MRDLKVKTLIANEAASALAEHIEGCTSCKRALDEDLGFSKLCTWGSALALPALKAMERKQ